ncbi:MAG: tRNA threonylcarbamoyladenosine dehydratase [Eubacterium sp.]|nr:tRNA threonylcarbamoyladenosine dehydratase [Eubacterium sp.]
MAEIFDREVRMLGETALKRLKDARVILFGVGGVGSYVAEGLVRCGVGHLTLVDKDVVDITNINRQLIALHSTLGQVKVEAARARLLDINPEAEILALKKTLTPESLGEFHLETYDYVVDAIDMVTAKLALAVFCSKEKIPVIASMGTGNKLDPSKLQITDIYKTSVCPLAKVMRRELKARRVKKLKVICSSEVPAVRCTPPGSVSFVPSVAGLMLAGEVVRDLIKA